MESVAKNANGSNTLYESLQHECDSGLCSVILSDKTQLYPTLRPLLNATETSINLKIGAKESEDGKFYNLSICMQSSKPFHCG
ncbi:hypothetical protein D5086_014061 [Populus alba]|uniref:Uncharacterized protein n=1 Tax=Populus alba TaxID=43335 RepID=A0ACC4C6R8_POPAL